MKNLISTLILGVGLVLGTNGYSQDTKMSEKTLIGRVDAVYNSLYGNYRKPYCIVYTIIKENNDTAFYAGSLDSNFSINPGDFVKINYTKNLPRKIGKKMMMSTANIRGNIFPIHPKKRKVVKIDNCIILKENKEKFELEKYNSENKQVYSDFVEFVKETKSYGMWGNGQVNKNEFLHSCNFKGQNLRIRLDEDKDLRIMINFMGENWESWSDNKADGLIEEYGKESLGRDEKNLNKFSPDKQIEITKECTKTLKEIMHEGKYKNY